MANLAQVAISGSSKLQTHLAVRDGKGYIRPRTTNLGRPSDNSLAVSSMHRTRLSPPQLRAEAPLHACAAAAPAAWHLAWVRVVNLATGDRALFAANAWLDASVPGGSTWMQLAATQDAPAAPAAAAGGLPEQRQPGQLGGRGSAFGPAVHSGVREGAAGTAALKLTKAWAHGSRLGQPGYTVTFTTSNILGAGTAARVR